VIADKPLASFSPSGGGNWKKGMPPGADVATAAHRQLDNGTGGLRVANIVRGGAVKDMAGEKAGSRPGGEQQPVLSARERLRLHVNRNLALQQGNSKNAAGSDRGPASAGGPPIPPRGASPANSNTPPPLASGKHGPGSPTSDPLASPAAQRPVKRVCQSPERPGGVQSLNAITDTRLGKGDIAESVLSPTEMLNLPLNSNLEDPFVQPSPLASADDEASRGFDDSTETPPFIPTQEWTETSLGEGGADSSQLYYNEDGSRGVGGNEAVVDDDWVQGLYDMEGMS